MTDLALELIGQTKDKGYIFPTPIKIRVIPLKEHALAVAVRRNLAVPIKENPKHTLSGDGKAKTENLLQVEKFTPHDLRRTAATFLAELETSDEVIDAILNHVKGGVIGTYNRYKYDKQKQVALTGWEHMLISIIGKVALI